MDQYSLSIGLVSLPLPIVLTAILPYLLPIAILHPIKEFTCEDGSVGESDGAVGLAEAVVYHFVGYPVLVVGHWATLEMV